MIPLGVYLLSYVSFFYQHGPAIRDFLSLQLRMLEYQQRHLHIQPENSQPWTWPLLLHPIRYFRATTTGTVYAIVALGNPAIWWGFLALLPVGLFTVARRPTWRDALIFGGYLAMFLPWLVVPRSRVPLLHAPRRAIHVPGDRCDPARPPPPRRRASLASRSRRS